LLGSIVPVVMNVYKDRTFSFIIKKPPASRLVLKAIGKEKGSDKPHSTKIAKLSQKQLEDIANEKMEDLNALDLDHAKKIIAGTARSMGVDVDSK
jgi:large subunit ribosomal protein L11